MSGFTFYGCFSGVVPPVPADPRVQGVAPVRAVAHCEPFRAAAGYGWYVCPPLDFLLRWDGGAIQWMPAGATTWLPASSVPVRTLYRATGQEVSDDPLLDLGFLITAREPGVLQIWTGLVAVSSPEWALLVRGIPNLPGELTYETLEGIIETGWWHGPLLGSIRFRRTDEVVMVSRRRPLFVMQPVRSASYQSAMARNMTFVPATPDNRATVGGLLADALSVREEDNPGGYRREVVRRQRGR